MPSGRVAGAGRAPVESLTTGWNVYNVIQLRNEMELMLNEAEEITEIEDKKRYFCEKFKQYWTPVERMAELVDNIRSA